VGYLIRAIYLSEVNIISNNILDEIRKIHSVANERNKKANISGVLLFSDRFFLQLLEGPRLAVTECLGRILNDDRHDRIRLCSVEEISARLFGEWSMRLVSGVPVFRLKQDQRTFDPSEASADDLLRMIIDGCTNDQRGS
jgi:Sensors of blue-light using FAD